MGQNGSAPGTVGRPSLRVCGPWEIVRQIDNGKGLGRGALVTFVRTEGIIWLKANTPWNEESQTTMTIRNRGLRTDRHQDSKEDRTRTRWEPVLTDKALAAKAEIRRDR